MLFVFINILLRRQYIDSQLERDPTAPASPVPDLSPPLDVRRTSLPTPPDRCGTVSWVTPINKNTAKFRSSYSPSDYPEPFNVNGDPRVLYGSPQSSAIPSILGGTADFFVPTASPFNHADDPATDPSNEYSPDSKPPVKRSSDPALDGSHVLLDAAAASAAAASFYYTPFSGALATSAVGFGGSSSRLATAGHQNQGSAGRI